VSAGLGVGVFLATMIAAVQWGTTPDGASIRTEKWEWLGELGLSIDLRLDSFAVMMVLASLITCGLLVGASFSGDGLLLELAIVLGLLGFLTAVTVARFIERTGQ